MFPLFDLHCDTPRYITDNKQSLRTSSGHISLDKASAFSPYFQVAAIWCTFDDTDQAKDTFNKTVTYHTAECESNRCDIITSSADLINSVKCQANGGSDAGFIYCIEDCGFITSLDALDEVYKRGVRVLIPMWGKTNALGSSHEAEGGLTELGKLILNEAAKIGMILDISHASVESAKEIMDIAERNASPVIASHSNSRRSCDHTRNLYTDQIKRLVSLGGIVGHSLCPRHLSIDGNADISKVLDNIAHLIEDAGEDNVCFGCDLDGTDLPNGITDINSLRSIYNAISLRFSPQTADKIIYQNALNKFQQFLK